jgi:hypothetical protein
VKPRALTSFVLAVTLVACASPAATAPPSVTARATPLKAALPQEAILILAPGSGSRLVDQVHVEGEADSTFEQTLVVEVVLLGDPETVLTQQPVMIEAELGQRGPFAADLLFDIGQSSDAPGEIRVYAISPRDGGITHLSSAHVTLASTGASEARPAGDSVERIVIASPAPGAIVAGGFAHLEGVGLASFEQTLVARIYGADGVLIGQAPITVAADEYGVRGPFAVDVPYTVGAAGPGRIVVLDPSPAFGQTLHLASVEVLIEP